MKTLIDRDYTDEDLYDLEQHIEWELEKVPMDKHGFRKGVFHVTFTWDPDKTEAQ